MKIGIIGYGRMGKAVAEIAKSKGHRIFIISPDCKDADFNSLSDIKVKLDVCIDFTIPKSIIENITFYCNNKMNAVVGTTGWYDNLNEVERMVQKSKIGFVWASNFSIGVNAFFRIIKETSSIMNNINDYDVAIHEFHHNQKLDSPSGTAKSISKIIIDNIDYKKKVVCNSFNQKIKNDELHCSSTRIGNVPGTHSVLFDSNLDSIELKHTARSRYGFASGAVEAAEWLYGKKGFFNINDLMNDLFD